MTSTEETLAWLEEKGLGPNGGPKPCKVDGCDQPAAAQYGRYGGLCEQHKPASREQKRKPKPALPKAVKRSLPELAEKIERQAETVKAAQAELEQLVARMRQRLEQLP